MTVRRRLAVLALAGLGLAACGSDPQGPAGEPAATPPGTAGSTTGASTTAPAPTVPANTAPAVEPVELVDVVHDVEHYPACGNMPYTVGDSTWYPVVDWGSDEIFRVHARITAVPRDEPPAPHGLRPRVPAPGPGDAVGTLVIWADGVARFTSDSGRVEWATVEPQTYTWVC